MCESYNFTVKDLVSLSEGRVKNLICYHL